MLTLFFKLLIAHALADYPLQNDTMSRCKSRHQPGDVNWWYWLTAHCLIQAGAVWMVLGNPYYALAELALHGLIDFAKCEKWINLHIDQSLHALCKLGYVIVYATC